MLGSQRPRQIIATVGVCVAALCGASMASAALGGDAGGITLARRIMHVMAVTRVATYTETGYVTMDSGQGRLSYFNWLWGTAGVQRGWVGATEHALLVLDRHGRVLWWRDDLTPRLAPCHTALCSHVVPVEVIATRHGHFYAFGSAAHHSCFGRLSGTTPYNAGSVPYRIQGELSAPVRTGSSLRLTYRYAWGFVGRATETDVVSAATARVRSGEVHVSGPSPSSAFTFGFRYSYPRRMPAMPAVPLCH